MDDNIILPQRFFHWIAGEFSLWKFESMRMFEKSYPIKDEMK